MKFLTSLLFTSCDIRDNFHNPHKIGLDMGHNNIIAIPSIRINITSVLFSLWSFIVLCRPQDYLLFLEMLRPCLTFGLITFASFILTQTSINKEIVSGQFKLFLMLILIMIIGIPFSYYRSESLKDVFSYASASIMFYFLFYQLVNDIGRIRRLLFLYCCGATIYAIYQLLFGIGERLSFGTMFDPNDISFFLINFIFFNLLFINKNNKVYMRLIGLINILVCSAVILKTGSRGGVVAFASVFAFLLFAHIRTINISFFKKAFLLTLIFISLLLSTTNYERYRTILDIEDDYNWVDETGRVAIWKIGLKLVLSNPLTGVGVGRFNEGVGRDREERGLQARWQSAHNSFVQIGAESGVIGLILYVMMTCKVFSITSLILKKSQSDDFVKISEMAKAGFIGHVVCAMFLSQAYSIYWVFYIVLSAKLHQLLNEEADMVGTRT